MKFVTLLALAGLLTGAAQPALAADRDLAFAPTAERASGAFVGAYLRVPLDGSARRAAEPRAGLKLSMTHSYRDVRAASGGRSYEGEMIDLGFTAGERPALRLVGQDVTSPAGRLGYADGEKRGGFKWWIPVAIVGAVGIGLLGFYAYVNHENENGCCE